MGGWRGPERIGLSYSDPSPILAVFGEIKERAILSVVLSARIGQSQSTLYVSISPPHLYTTIDPPDLNRGSSLAPVMSLPAPLSPARHNLAPGRPTRLACSAVDLLWVMSYAPSEGVHGTPISVNFACRADLPGIHIRLVVGRRAVSTHVREIDAGHWQLIGHAPAFAKHKSDVPMLPLTIQAVDRENRVVDSVTFGDFVYHRSPRPALRIAPDTRSPYTQPLTPASSDSEHGSPRHTPALRRASRQMGADPDDPARTVLLDITTALDSFCYDWDDSELNAGRRLVRFRRLQDGNRLIVSPERISQAEYDPDDIVISCIYRQETDACCVTSVDIIHLLQRLVEADFEVDEKNRIRRNLEGLRPTTVSKTRPGFESFFQRIMDFPDPKPRKIEKDVKVFDWKLLPHALDKILSKYVRRSTRCHHLILTRSSLYVRLPLPARPRTPDLPHPYTQ